MNAAGPDLAVAGAKMDILSTLRARRDEFTEKRHIPADAVDLLKKLGCYRAFVPRSFGGLEMTPADFCRLVEDIATADASAGWVSSFGVSTFYLSRLPTQTFAKIYADGPDVVFAGALFPPQVATIDGDRIGINGRWKYCSGVMGASMVGVGVRHDSWDKDAQPFTAVLPAGDITIHENWQAIGLRATGSHDISVTDKTVTRDWMFARNAKPNIDIPLYRYPLMCLVPQSMAAVGLGTAREALDTLAATARGEASITGAISLDQRGYVLADLARATAMLEAARSYFYGTIEETWASVLAGVEPDVAHRNKLRLAATHAAHMAAEVTRMAFVAGGTRAIAGGHALGRCMNDAACVAQHATLGEGNWTAGGGVMLTGEPGAGYP